MNTPPLVTRVTLVRRVSLVEQDLPTLPEHRNSSPVLRKVRVPQPIVFCVVFCRSLFVLFSIFVWLLCCLSLDLRILNPLWYLQTLFVATFQDNNKSAFSYATFICSLCLKITFVLDNTLVIITRRDTTIARSCSDIRVWCTG